MQFSKSALVAFVGAVATVSAQSVAKFEYGTASNTAYGVRGRNANGPTNPDAPSLGTPVNQTSVSRLASINSIDDWCTFSSPNGEMIADVEGETVAWCTKARNNARVIVSILSLFDLETEREKVEQLLTNAFPASFTARRYPYRRPLRQDPIVPPSHGPW